MKVRTRWLGEPPCGGDVSMPWNCQPWEVLRKSTPDRGHSHCTALRQEQACLVEGCWRGERAGLKKGAPRARRASQEATARSANWVPGVTRSPLETSQMSQGPPLAHSHTPLSLSPSLTLGRLGRIPKSGLNSWGRSQSWRGPKSYLRVGESRPIKEATLLGQLSAQPPL